MVSDVWPWVGQGHSLWLTAEGAARKDLTFSSFFLEGDMPDHQGQARRGTSRCVCGGGAGSVSLPVKVQNFQLKVREQERTSPPNLVETSLSCTYVPLHTNPRQPCPMLPGLQERFKGFDGS